MNNKTVLIGLGVLIAVGAIGLFLIYGKGGSSNLYNTTNVTNPTTAPTTLAQPSGNNAVAKAITVEATEFKFSPSTINLKVGDKVSLTFKNSGTVGHNFTVTDLGVLTKTVGPGESDTITFTVDKAGTFDFICTIDGHSGLGMKGQIVVK